MHPESMHFISLLLSQLALLPGGKASAPVKTEEVSLKGREALLWP